MEWTTNRTTSKVRKVKQVFGVSRLMAAMSRVSGKWESGEFSDFKLCHAQQQRPAEALAI